MASPFRKMAVFLLLFALNTVLGLYRLPMKDKEGKLNSLVPKTLHKKDYIYLYQFNRTSFVPTLSVHDQFIEGILILMNLKFHRIANQFLLGSQTTGIVPFIQYNGKYYDGVENILKFLNKKYGEEMKKLPKYEKDKEVQKFALDISFKILMKDRSRRIKKETENEISTSTKTIPPMQKSIIKQKMTKEEKKANSEMEGLDFMLYDQGIREQMFPAIPGQLGQKNLDLGELKWHGWSRKFTVRELNRQFLTDYFNLAYDGENIDDDMEIKENVIGLDDENWNEFEKEMEDYITGVFRQVLISDNGNSWEEKLKPLLEQNKYEDGRTYARIDEAELYGIFMDKLDELVIPTLKQTKIFLGGNEPSIGDMALFSILVQFFETPLNIPEFKQLFQGDRLNSDDIEILQKVERKAKYEKHAKKNVKRVRNFLAHYCERMKAKLGIGKNLWTLLTQKPWPLNYEDIWREEYPNKYDGPYYIETDHLKDLPKGKFNKKDMFLEEIVPKLKAKAKELWIEFESENNGNNKEHIKKWINGEQNLVKIMLTETAAYLCFLGYGNEELGEHCRKKHSNNIEKIPNKISEIPLPANIQQEKEDIFKQEIEEIKQKTRKIVYGTIVDCHDKLVREKVTEETNRVAELVKNDPDNVANYLGKGWQ